MKLITSWGHLVRYLELKEFVEKVHTNAVKQSCFARRHSTASMKYVMAKTIIVTGRLMKDWDEFVTMSVVRDGAHAPMENGMSVVPQTLAPAKQLGIPAKKEKSTAKKVSGKGNAREKSNRQLKFVTEKTTIAMEKSTKTFPFRARINVVRAGVIVFLGI